MAKTHVVGYCKCPSEQCSGLVFFIKNSANGSLLTFPPARLEFDAAGIPPNVIKSFTEAITCHAQKCYTAAAIMVFKTLEALCFDLGVTGDTLSEKLVNLQTRIILPKDLIDGMSSLQLLGEEAAKVESVVFSRVTGEEVEVGIEITKEILKAIYQYDQLLKRLKGLRRELKAEDVIRN